MKIAKLVDGILTEVKLESPAGRPGTMFVRGEFARADEATANGRIYPRTLWETQIQRLSPAMADRKVLGELDHPDDGRTLLQRVSHYMTGLHVAEDGRVIGEAIILDTARGRDLKAMLEAGCKIGVSSRGFGTTQPHPTLEGKEVVQEDYQLETFDFVAQPADASAYPQMFTEGYQRSHPNNLFEAYTMKTDNAAITNRVAVLEGELARLIESQRTPAVQGKPSPELLAQLTAMQESLADLKSRFTALSEEEHRDSLVEAQEQLNEAQAELQSTKSELAEAKTALQEVETRFEQRGQLLHEAACQLFLTQKLHAANLSPSDALAVRRAVGADMTAYKDIISLGQVVENAVDKIRKQHAAILAEKAARARRAQELEEARQAERAAAEAERLKLEEKLAMQQEAHEKVVEALQLQRLQVYIERSLRDHPRADQIRAIIESSDVYTEAAVDAIIAANTQSVSRSTGAAAARDRVRAMSGHRTGTVHEGARREAGRGRREVDIYEDVFNQPVIHNV